EAIKFLLGARHSSENLSEEQRRVAEWYRTVARRLIRAGDPMRAALEAHVGDGDSVAVYGSIVPLYETICILKGIVPVAVGVGSIWSECSDIKTSSYSEVCSSGLRFDRVIAPLIVHRAGLGLVGEEIDPDGDLNMLLRLDELLNPGGRLLLTVPVG